MKVSLEKESLSRLNSVLLAHNPINVINRGYAVVQDCDNNIISDINTLKQKEEIKITLRDGNVKCKVDFTK
jgi:exodeoxyribonuclease VII large subunit